MLINLLRGTRLLSNSMEFSLPVILSLMWLSRLRTLKICLRKVVRLNFYDTQHLKSFLWCVYVILMPESSFHSRAEVSGFKHFSQSSPKGMFPDGGGEGGEREREGERSSGASRTRPSRNLLEYGTVLQPAEPPSQRRSVWLYIPTSSLHCLDSGDLESYLISPFLFSSVHKVRIGVRAKYKALKTLHGIQ